MPLKTDVSFRHCKGFLEACAFGVAYIRLNYRQIVDNTRPVLTYHNPNNNKATICYWDV